MAEVVMGIYLHHMVEMNERFQSLMEDDPLNRLGLYKVNMRKAFNHLLICLEMGEYDVSKPMTVEVCRDPYHPVT